MTKFSGPQATFSKKTGQKMRFMHFLENFSSSFGFTYKHFLIFVVKGYRGFFFWGFLYLFSSLPLFKNSFSLRFHDFLWFASKLFACT